MEEEFSSGGDEGDFGGFALGPQALVKGFQDRVVPGGDKGGHPKTGAHGGAATGDVAPGAPVLSPPTSLPAPAASH